MNYSQSLFKEAQDFLPGGVNSPVRAFGGVAGEPLFIQSGSGAYITDVDNKQYIDYVCSWGPLIVGHSHPYVLQKVTESLQLGLSFGAPTQVEIQLAQKVCELMPSIEMIRFVSSGTEASMSAIRLARGFTKRNKIIKFAGCYHGHADSLLVAAGSGGLTFGVPNSAGVPQSIVQHTLVATFNHLEEVAALFAAYKDDIAAVILEPVAANMNLVLPTLEFLSGVRHLCDQHRSLLIFDEVITGFRMGIGGAQAFYNIMPDLTILGKIVGGGLPAAAFGGRAEIMRLLTPLGSVYQAGTLSGNPIAMTAGLATLELISQPNFYTNLQKNTERLVDGLNASALLYNFPFFSASIGAAMFGLYFTSAKKIVSEIDVKNCDIENFKRFFYGMLEQGIYLAPSAFEIGFVSAAHGEKEIDITIKAAEKVFANFK